MDKNCSYPLFRQMSTEQYKHKIRISIKRPFEFGSGGTNRRDLLCLQDDRISYLEFKEADSGWKRIWNFSLRHILHVFVMGVKS